MKKRQLILGLVVLAALVGLGTYAQHRYPIDWREVLAQFGQARWGNVAVGIGCIYFGYTFRAVRWAWLLRHNKKISPVSLLGTQVIGFTAVALIGRVADPVRPYLVARKTGLPLGSQIAVYIVERLFDAGTMALIFSSAILLTTWFGATGALLVSNRPFGFVALLGLIALAGMIMRNTVILVDQIDRDIAAGHGRHCAIIDATVRRARPVVLTALAAILGMIPLAGSIFWGPMAITIIGGLCNRADTARGAGAVRAVVPSAQRGGRQCACVPSATDGGL